MRGADALVVFWLAFLPVGLGLVGVAIAYDLAGRAWAIPLGGLLGLGVGAAFVRDYLRWRFGALSLVGVAVFLAFFVVSQYLTP